MSSLKNEKIISFEVLEEKESITNKPKKWEKGKLIRKHNKYQKKGNKYIKYLPKK